MSQEAGNKKLRAEGKGKRAKGKGQRAKGKGMEAFFALLKKHTEIYVTS
jgi:uncharacterized protein YjbJ (UPF0337 family)